MTWSDAFGATWRSALLFAAAFTVLGFLIDMTIGRGFEPVQRILTVVIASGLYWALIAWRKRS